MPLADFILTVNGNDHFLPRSGLLKSPVVIANAVKQLRVSIEFEQPIESTWPYVFNEVCGKVEHREREIQVQEAFTDYCPGFDWLTDTGRAGFARSMCVELSEIVWEEGIDLADGSVGIRLRKAMLLSVEKAAFPRDETQHSETLRNGHCCSLWDKKGLGLEHQDGFHRNMRIQPEINTRAAEQDDQRKLVCQ